MKKQKKSKKEDFYIRSSCSLHLHRSGGKTQFLFFQITSVHSDPFLISTSFKFGLVHFSAVQYSLILRGTVGSSSEALTVTVCFCLIRLSSTATRSCPSHQSTQGGYRHTGRSHWLHGCYGLHKRGWEPGKNIKQVFQNTVNQTFKILSSSCIASYPELRTGI